ncbi:amino acid permease [Thermoflavimicrobium daqui]|uniref:Amino acid permease n=1 Tax=Thermoflavimicrobium daqui TaxID=2137476 RepID=A0A364K1F6_9BACL|nr:amino acid permease [Thermoflavimicrobium daqui]RAL21861.1 amino acid permease [Thermoflavimicrobium daqui]
MAKQQVSLFERENVLERKLTAKQLTMVAIGSAVGTGLFMGSGLVISYAGPGAILSYAVAALLTFIMLICLAEMTVKHPTAGSFGTHAEHYLGAWSGYLVRWSYWLINVLAIGSEVTAIALYMNFWFSGVPKWVWIILFSLVIIYFNARSVNSFGTLEYWFSFIKVVAIIGFIMIGLAMIFGLGTKPVGFSNYVSHGGFLPFGWGGIWLGIGMASFSYFGSELIAVTAGESKDPANTIPKTMRLTAFRLIIFYVLSMIVMLAVVPWSQSGAKEIVQSPFVKVFSILGIPGADHVMNFVVLIAALSAMNAQVYGATRMLFSLSKGGYAPTILGRLNSQQVPVYALLLSCVGLFLAIILNIAVPDAYNILFGIVIFGGLFCWSIIFVTYFSFRKANASSKLVYRAPLYPLLPVIGLLLVLGILITLWFMPEWRFVWYVGVSWLVLLSILYFLRYQKKIVKVDK